MKVMFLHEMLSLKSRQQIFFCAESKSIFYLSEYYLGSIQRDSLPGNLEDAAYSKICKFNFVCPDYFMRKGRLLMLTPPTKFILQAESKRLYKTFMKLTRKIENKQERRDMRRWICDDFKLNKNSTDEVKN